MKHIWPAPVMLGVLLVSSCGDDAPPDPDAAAACTCPAAEPPLGGRIVRVSQTFAVPANTRYSSGAADCPQGATLLSGGCYVDVFGAGPGDLLLIEAGPRFETGFDCAYKSTFATDSSGMAVAICLLPAQQ